jgi:hypothetical protein
MISSSNLDQMSSDQLRALAAQLLSQVDTMGKKINRDQTVIEKLTHEIAQLNGHDPYAYLKDVLTRLPTQRASDI